MHFPHPVEPAHHRWIPILCGILAGLGILTLVWEARRPRPAPEPPLPPRVALDLPAEGLTAEIATDLLIDAVIQIESHGNPEMVGSAGERGLMQIMRTTWAEVTERHFGEALEFDLAFDPEVNRRVGTLYLGDLQVYLYQNRDLWKSDLRSLLLACYNAGPQRVREAGFDLRRLPEVVQSYAARGSALHDWYLGEHSEELRERLMEAGGSAISAEK